MGKIGVFDSGYGGLTVLQSLVEKLPNYDFIYYGDNLRAPYGTRSFNEVYRYTLKAVQELIAMDCPLIILACNTASAKALRSIQQHYIAKHEPNKRVLGVIRPSAEVIDRYSKTKHIALLATPGTVKSDSYKIELEKFAPHSTLYQYACTNWVSLIENNQWNTPFGEQQITHDLNRLLDQSKQIDTLLLACTHYPILIPLLVKKTPKNIRIIAQGDIVANSLVDYLMRHPQMDQQLSKKATIQYYTSGDPALFNLQAQKIIHMNTQAIQWEDRHLS